MRRTVARAPTPARGPPPTLLRDTLLERFPSEVLQRIAEETGFVRRHRKVDPDAFFSAATLEAGVYLQRSLEQLPRYGGQRWRLRCHLRLFVNHRWGDIPHSEWSRDATTRRGVPLLNAGLHRHAEDSGGQFRR
jgi:hypothetical protein